MKRVVLCVLIGSLLGGAVPSAEVDIPFVGSEPQAGTYATSAATPSIRDRLPALWRFLETLHAEVEAGRITSTEQSIERCRQFYTAAHMAEIEAAIPGWKHMASFDDSKTLWHINLAMVALLQLPEYRSLSPSEQTVQQWIVLLHDLAKEPDGGRDHRHPFRSAAQAARVLTAIGFPKTAAYQSEFAEWFALTDSASRFDEGRRFQIQDNRKLPGILSGATRILAEPTRTAVAVIALHQSITSLAAWPVPAPLTDEQVRRYVDAVLVAPLLTLTLADTGGWNLFDPPTLTSMYHETREVFRGLNRPSSK